MKKKLCVVFLLLFAGEAVSTEDEVFLEENYYNYLQGILAFEKDVSVTAILQAQQKINEIYLANHLYTVSAINATEGLKLFMKETRQSVDVIMFLLLFIMVLVIIPCIVVLLAKFKRLNVEELLCMRNG